MSAAMMRASTAKSITTAKPTQSATTTVERSLPFGRCVKVTGLDQKEFTSQFLAEKVGDYFYAQDCEVTAVEVLAEAVLVTFADGLAVDRAMALHGIHDSSVQAGNKWRPHGRLLCKTGGLIIQRIVPVSPKVATAPVTAKVHTAAAPSQLPIKSSVPATKKPIVIQKSVIAPTKPRPWDPCDKVVVVPVMEGISLEELQSILLGADEVNYKFLNSLPYSEIRYHRDKLEFSIRAKHQSALLQAEELIQDLLEHVKEEVEDRLKVEVDGIHRHEQQENLGGSELHPRPHTRDSATSAALGAGLQTEQEKPLAQPKEMDDIRVQVVQYNKLAPFGWAVPCGFSTISKVNDVEETKSEASTTTVDDNKDAETEANDDEDTKSEATTSCESVGFVQVERIVQKATWTCVCGTMNFGSHSCWCGRMRSYED